MAKDSNRLICEYLRKEGQGELPDELRQQMRRSPELNKELAFYGELREAISDEGMISFRQQIDRVFERRHRKRWIDLSRCYPRHLVLAGVVILIAVAGVFWLTNRPVQPKDLFDQYYVSYPGMPVVRSGRSLEGGLMGQAFRHYNHEDWDASARCFRQLISKGKNSSLALFYLGLVNLELGNEQEALEHFNATIKRDQNLFEPQAYWYSALAYLRAGQEGKALDRLSFIIDRDMWNAEEARRIIREIRQPVASF